ncbi:AAA+-type ATPase [Elasticomyces elasticus]|nr:AAA+-type ATPase [Elasticomyces elasticus]KAK4913730.1 AAA+-type ATPase [Elasticomyces elasticus]KAK5747731.1 AAA+-type ATPase [Elasticomyces elasticus]
MATMSYNPLRMHPPDGAGSGRNRQQSFMADPTSFVVRTLQPITNSLEGAFRVHLTQDSLTALGLNTGDLCLITTGSTTGLGIAWRATDKMGNSPKHRPAKMTETLRGAFGISDGAQVTIGRAKTGTKIVLAERVVLTDVTPSDSGYATGLEDDKWLARATTTLHECEAVAVGTTFDVKSKRQLKKRFFVDHIEGAGAVGPALFRCSDSTKITISDGSQVAEIVSTNGVANTQFPLLEMSKIGGLVAQVQELNRHLDDVLRRSREEASRSQESRHVLLHGYEGTGKSMLLKRIRQSAQGSGCRVFDLKLDGTTVKMQSQVSDMFRDARAAAPSIVLVDNIERKFSKDQTIMVDALANELDRLAGTNVIVVAATRSINDVSGELLHKGGFRGQIELPIPDTAARKEILVALLPELPAADRNALADAVAQKTHGFTGRDLDDLTGDACWIAKYRDHDDWIQVGARASVLNGTPTGTVSSQMDGSVHSQATTEVEQATHTLASLAIDHDRLPTIDDFTQALTGVRPSALRELFFEKPKIRWSDIGGSDAAKQRFDDAIGIPLHHADIVAKRNAAPSTGVLLYGPPGCSKTMTAQAVAATYDLNFIAVKGAELISMYVGESERAVRNIFRKAAQAAPCMIFFDEIDAIGSERESGGTKGLNVLTTLLTEMDGFNARQGVYVLAATNKPESLDPALLRPGRFDSLVYVGLPTAEARHEILNIALRGQPVPVSAAEITRLTNETEGYSGAEVVGVCQVAKMAAVKREIRGGNVAMAREDFEEGFKQVTKGVTVNMLAGYEAFAARGMNR